MRAVLWLASLACASGSDQLGVPLTPKTSTEFNQQSHDKVQREATFVFDDFDRMLKGMVTGIASAPNKVASELRSLELWANQQMRRAERLAKGARADASLQTAVSPKTGEQEQEAPDHPPLQDFRTPSDAKDFTDADELNFLRHARDQVKMRLQGQGEEESARARELFDQFVSETAPTVLAYPLKPAMPGTTDRVAVIIEPRAHERLAWCVKLAMQTLGPKWALAVYTHKNNEDFIRKQLGLAPNDPRVLLYNTLPSDNMDLEAYNAFRGSLGMYEQLEKYEHMLFFETDSALFRPFSDDLLQYDLVGAPWEPCDSGCPQGGGNGGLTLRRRSASLKVIAQCGSGPGVTEDWWMSTCLEKLNGKLPPRHVAAGFSVEMLFSAMPSGVHKPWNYMNYDQLYQILDTVPLWKQVRGHASAAAKSLPPLQPAGDSVPAGTAIAKEVKDKEVKDSKEVKDAKDQKAPVLQPAPTQPAPKMSDAPADAPAFNSPADAPPKLDFPSDAHPSHAPPSDAPPSDAPLDAPAHRHFSHHGFSH